MFSFVAFAGLLIYLDEIWGLLELDSLTRKCLLAMDFDNRFAAGPEQCTARWNICRGSMHLTRKASQPVGGPIGEIGMIQTLETIIGEYPFFQGIDQKHVDSIAECAGNARFEKGQLVFHEGDPADRFYLIREG